MRVAVFGAGGRMGQGVCSAIAADPSLDLVAAVDPLMGRDELGPMTRSGPQGDAGSTTRIRVVPGFDALEELQVEVAVDFTTAAAAMENLRWCAAHAVHAVVGTTGFSPAEETEIAALFGAGSANCILAANFAIGAVLMMRFAEMAARYMVGAEIVEMHHGGKLDAPSGTAAATARRIAAAGLGSAGGAVERQSSNTVPASPARGLMEAGGVRVHSVRLEGMLSHQEVIFGAPGQVLSIRHDSLDRSSFMPGVLLAINAVASRRGLTIGLDSLLDVS
ncbi:MAG: 4-hydroxy-tetrahydrodipicolinate reductase [Actinomycetota bacterium]|nr:4-hydroxy-tetrahydrodipicolinate reductase [Actinomycetota bacterium]